MLGLSAVAITSLVSAIGHATAQRFVTPYIPSLGIPFEGEILMALGIGGAIFVAKIPKLGWGKIIVLILLAVVIGVGIDRSTLLQRGGM